MENHTCRICFEPCQEETPCKCIGYVHKDCQEKWLNINGRRECEICLEPFKTNTVYDCKCVRLEHRCNVGTTSDATIVLIMMIALNAVYGLCLLLIKDWTYLVWATFAVTVIILYRFNYTQMHGEDVALIWKCSNTIVLGFVYCVRLGIGESGTTGSIAHRVHMVYIDLALLSIIIIIRVLCVTLRATRVRRFFEIVVEGGHVCGGVGEEEEEDPHVEG